MAPMAKRKRTEFGKLSLKESSELKTRNKSAKTMAFVAKIDLFPPSLSTPSLGNDHGVGLQNGSVSASSMGSSTSFEDRHENGEFCVY
ncbi:hypothetical protein PanWU01x14_224280, partial [Parasponia andersonii]